MGDLSLIVFTANSKDGAEKALEIAKQLDRDGWIELIDYGLMRKDAKGHLATRELADELPEKIAAVSVAAAGGVVGAAVGGPMGAATGVAAGALVGVGSMRLMETVVRDTLPHDVLKSFKAMDSNSSVLTVVVEERYAERLNEEFKKLGSTVEHELKRAERDAEFEAYVERSKAKIRSMQEDIEAKLKKAQMASAAEKTKIHADVAARRAELDAQRERLEHRLKEMNNDLKSEIRDMNFRFELAGLRARAGIAASLNDLHRELNHFNSDLEDLIESRIGTLKARVAELKTQADVAGAETKAAIESHLHDVERRLRNERAQLQESFEDRLLQLKQWFETLQVQASLAQADLRDKIQAAIEAAQHSFAELKARIRTRKREDERGWQDIRAGFEKAAKDLQAAFDEARHERL